MDARGTLIEETLFHIPYSAVRILTNAFSDSKSFSDLFHHDRDFYSVYHEAIHLLEFVLEFILSVATKNLLL